MKKIGYQCDFFTPIEGPRDDNQRKMRRNSELTYGIKATSGNTLVSYSCTSPTTFSVYYYLKRIKLQWLGETKTYPLSWKIFQNLLSYRKNPLNWVDCSCYKIQVSRNINKGLLQLTFLFPPLFCCCLSVFSFWRQYTNLYIVIRLHCLKIL